ncbi:MAG: DUF3124 domain-containing protein [Syntrophales bacterium]|nr:DUF3124 domain-containing protein [Syntrophales bacterium]MDD5642393.1 DUF3124 domain-containing protein [Syntrophales bacterium]
MKSLKGKFCLLIILSAIMIMSLSLNEGRAASDVALSKGQLVYVPVYSHIYWGDLEKKFLLTGIVSVRNTDQDHAITIVSADYYDSDGKLIKSYLPKPLTLNPMASSRFIVKESDTKGGSGANFLVRWKAETEVNEPIMEAVMIGTAFSQGISFTSRGKAIKNLK